MKICVATVSYRGWRDDELDETLRYAASAGYSFVEIQFIPGNLFGKLVEEGSNGMKKLSGMLKKSGLTPVAVYCPPFGGRDEEGARKATNEIAKFIEAAKQLGCEVVVSTDGPREEGGIKRIVKTLEKLEPNIETTGIKIGLEPHLHNRIEQISDYDQIFSILKNENIGICIDTGHFHLANVDVPKLIAKYPYRIYHVHLKDYKGDKPVPFGEGDIDNLGCLRALKKIGYEGYISIELEFAYGLEVKKEEVPKYVKAARVYAEDLLRKIQYNET